MDFWIIYVLCLIKAPFPPCTDVSKTSKCDENHGEVGEISYQSSISSYKSSMKECFHRIREGRGGKIGLILVLSQVLILVFSPTQKGKIMGFHRIFPMFHRTLYDFTHLTCICRRRNHVILVGCIGLWIEIKQLLVASLRSRPRTLYHLGLK